MVLSLEACPGLLLQSAEARLPVALGELLEQRPGRVGAAGFLQVHGPVVEDLGVGRLGAEGGGVGVVGQLEVALAAELLGESQPRRCLFECASTRRLLRPVSCWANSW